MKIIEKANGRVEYYPTDGCRFVTKDRTKTYPWFLVLRPGDKIENYEDLPEEQVLEIEEQLRENEEEEEYAGEEDTGGEDGGD